MRCGDKMRVYSFLYQSIQQFKNFVVNNRLDNKKKYLIKIHSSNLLKDEIKPLVHMILKELPEAEIIGCSVGGIIFKGKNYEKETLVSIVDCKEAAVDTVSIMLKDGQQYKKPQKIVDEILQEVGSLDDSFLFAFYPPSFIYPSRFVEELNKRNKNYKMIGGGGYSPIGNLIEAPTYCIHNSNVLENMLVLTRIKGSKLIKNQATATGIESVGRLYEVTKSVGHHLIEIDHQPAKQWFVNLVGSDIEHTTALIDAFPLVRKDDEGYGLNLLYDVDPYTNQALGQDLFVFDEIGVGESLSIGYIDPNRAMNEVEKLCNEIEQSSAEALFAYSCMTRRNILQNCAEWELQPFTTTQITGAFMAGELVWNGKSCQYSNSAFTVASLSEDHHATINLDLAILKDSTKIQFDNLPLMNYIFSTANSKLKEEISENKRKLTDQLIMDDLTGLPNLSKFVFDYEQEQYTNLCLLSLKNENIIRVFLNKKHFVSYIEAMKRGCKEAFGDSYKIYLYNELSILIVGRDISKEVFVSDMVKLRTLLYQYSYEHYLPVYELSMAISNEDLLKKVELARLNLQKENKDLFVYLDDEENVNFANELTMLQVINEAISYKRVVPFYQGIYNNKTKQIELCESLMRIQDHHGRIYEPYEFLPIANEYKLYERLSKMMIEAVFEQAQKHPFSVTINLNVQDIYNYDILKMIFDHLEKSNQPGKFIFEIVEQQEVTDYEYLREFTNKIHKYGGKIAIDDFGSGYSNLLYVLRIDVDYIKITGEIVKELCQDDSCQQFVSMISNWCATRKKNVIAEYVENEDIQQKLMEYNVSYSQGYLFSRPQRLK